MRTPGPRSRVHAVAALSVVLAWLLVLVPELVARAAPAAEQAREAPEELYLVTLTGGGAAAHGGGLSGSEVRLRLLAQQDELLEAVAAPPPVYRWTAALNGFAVRLTGAQAALMDRRPEVVAVERNSVRRLAGTVSGGALAAPAPPSAPTGAGTVIGIVDSGIWPESPLFSNVPGLGPDPATFSGHCQPAERWPEGACNHKLVGARWFVAGFGADRLKSSAYLSPRDDTGHGTQVASVAAGNAGVSVRVGGERLGVYAGTAPLARVAVYKACWSAPDPRHDGCATADLVTAIDAAAEDGVDVLNLSVAGPDSFDTVERALLGATESGAFVAAAGGNTPDVRAAGHPGPWVTTVGATTARVPAGAVDLGATSLSGAMASRRTSGPASLVRAAAVPAPGYDESEAALCLPGSLDAARTANRIVVCDRGGIGRVDKSRAVALADGVGMILVNTRAGDVFADFHAVPTVHLDRPEARVLEAWLADHPTATATLRRTPAGPVDRRVAPFSAVGSTEGGVVKPDVSAGGVGALGGVPPTATAAVRWNHFSGTSAATARVSGHAAAVLSRLDWDPARVRSALATSARPVDFEVSALEQGAGRVALARALRPGLVYDVAPAALRRYLEGKVSGRDLNLPSIQVNGPAEVRRRVTNVGPRAMYYSVTATGFDRHDVAVTPAAIRIAPGQTRTYTVRIAGPTERRADSGWITWRGANGITVRIPVVIGD